MSGSTARPLTNESAEGDSYPSSPAAETVLMGIPTTPGIAIGDAFLYRHPDPALEERVVPPAQRPAELARLEEGLEATRRQLAGLRERMASQVGESVARIFDAQSAILSDEQFTGPVRSAVAHDGLNAESAVRRVAGRLQEAFARMEDQALRQRAQDIRDLAERLVRNLLGHGERPLSPMGKSCILITDDLLPSDVVHLMSDNILAVAAEMGEAASHTAIMTRALEVPAVVGLKGLSGLVAPKARVILNGNSGKVIVNPTPETEAAYRAKLERYQAYTASLASIETLPAITLDGHRVALRANIELPSEANVAVARGAEGVGLFRSEYLFLLKDRFPDEAEQVKDYRTVLERVAPHPVTIRTYDLGGDKIFPHLPHPYEANPFLGWRAIRVCLDEPNLLRVQLRAILKAAAAGSAKIMFPFISGLEELLQAKEHLAEVRRELEQQGWVVPPLPVGVMIEIPSAVLTADRLARHADFFSIGTNDLTQFTLAVDRGNQRVRRLYQPLHPAVIRQIKMTVEAGHQAGISVALCGELGAAPAATMLLVGLGVDELSVSPVAVPQIKKIIRSMHYRDAQAVAKVALDLQTPGDLQEFCTEEMKKRFADLPIWFT